MDDIDLAITRLAKFAQEDLRAQDAVRRAATLAQAPQPKGFLENLTALLSLHWSRTPLGQQRWREALVDEATRGAHDFVLGQPGNPYTWFLRDRFGQPEGLRQPEPTAGATPPRLGQLIVQTGKDNPISLGALALCVVLVVNRFTASEPRSWWDALGWTVLVVISALIARHGLRQGWRKISDPYWRPPASAPPTKPKSATALSSAASPADDATDAAPRDWTQGGQGDRFGPKVFCWNLSAERAAVDLLSDVARCLTHLQRVPAWNVNPTVIGDGGDDTTVKFSATGSYNWDNGPYLREANGVLAMSQNLTGQYQNGTGQVQVECTIATGTEKSLIFFGEVVLTGQQMVRLSFSENARPMWIRHQAEAHVALTVMELGQMLGEALKQTVDWRLVSGDWLENQAIETPDGSLMLRRWR